MSELGEVAEGMPIGAFDEGEAPLGYQTYVIQVRVPMPAEDGTWLDIARKHIKNRTQTGTVLTRVLAELGIKPSRLDRFRVLPPEAARERKVKEKAPVAPQYEVD